MKQFFQELHSRPGHEKRRISLQAASGIMAVIFLVWISTLGMRLAAGVDQSNSSPSGDTSGLAAGIAAAGGDIASGFGKIKSGLEVVQQMGSVIATTSAPAAAPATVLSGASVTATSTQNVMMPASEDYVPAL